MTLASSLRARLLRLVIVLLPLIVGLPRAYASLYVLSSEDLTGRADVVTLGKVVSEQSSWVNGRILTTVTLDVEGTFKGHGDSTVVFQVAGGKVGELAMSVSSEPVFALGERSLVFLKATKEEPRAPTLHLYGGKLGKIPIEQDAAGHDTVRWYRPDLHRVDVVSLSAFTQHIVDVVKGGTR